MGLLLKKLKGGNADAVFSAMDKSLAIIEFDPAGNILDANENFLCVMGYEAAELSGRHHCMFVEPDYAQSAEYAAFWHKLGQGEYDAAEYKRLGKGGREVWIQATYNPVFTAGGKVAKVIKFATDITAAKMKAAEDAGKIAAISRAQAVIEFTVDGEILTANENFLAAFGYKLSEVEGRHHRIFVEPDYAQSAEYAEFWRRLRAGEFIAEEFRRFGKGGSEVWIQATYNPVFDPDGRVMKIVKFATDITGRVDAVTAIGVGLGQVTEGDLSCEIAKPFIPALDKLRRDFNHSVETLRNARAEAAEALRNMSNGLVMVAGDGSIRLFNGRVLELFGLKPSQLRVGMPLAEYLANVGAIVGWGPERAQLIARNHFEWMAKDRITRVEHHFDDGKILNILCQPTSDGGAIITYEDVTEARESQKKITHMAFHDALTGLPNRRSFADHIGNVSQRSSFTMLMVDLDRFKEVNDTLGHAVGDKVLVEVARRLRNSCRPTDMVFRLGGDEIAVVARLTPNQAHAMASRLVTALMQPFQIGEHLISIGGSVGLVTARRGDDPELVQRKADLALYKAKENGRSRVEVYRDGMIEEAAERRRLEIELANASAARQFELHYQPLFDLPGRGLSGFEALVRWQHPERGLVPPTEFIPVAEQTGAIVEIGAWVIEEACRQAALWPADIYVSINVSPVQLRSADILRQLTSALDRHGLPPRRIEIEITETAMVENRQQIAAILSGLRALGVRIAMDDFGTGYSSLAHLREFELDRIKIDRSFISASRTDAGAAAVVRAVTGMARDLAIATTGEGVENEEQLANLIALGCGTAQGYLLGKPLGAHSATELVESLKPGTTKAARSPKRRATLAHAC